MSSYRCLQCHHYHMNLSLLLFISKFPSDSHHLLFPYCIVHLRPTHIMVSKLSTSTPMRSNSPWLHSLCMVSSAFSCSLHPFPEMTGRYIFPPLQWGCYGYTVLSQLAFNPEITWSLTLAYMKVCSCKALQDLTMSSAMYSTITII